MKTFHFSAFLDASQASPKLARVSPDTVPTLPFHFALGARPASLAFRWWIGLGCLLMSMLPATAQLYWRTDATSGTWTGTNWNDGSATTTGGTGWTDASNAVFSSDSTATFVDGVNFTSLTVGDGLAVTVNQAGTVAAGAHTIDVGTGSTLTWTGQKFTGSSLIKNGAGTWDMGSISAARTQTAGLTLNAGTLIFSNTNSLGNTASPVTFNGGTIQGGGTLKPTAYTIGGDFAVVATGAITFGAYSYTDTMNLGAATRTISVNTEADAGLYVVNVNTIISGAAGTGLNFAGPGKVSINASNNTYDGGTTISAGADVAYQSGGSFGTGDVTLDGGTLRWENGAPDISSRLIMGTDGGTIYTGSASKTFTGVVTGTGGLTTSGSGGLTLAAANTFSGATTVSAGTLTLSNNLALQNSTLNTAGAGAVTLSGATTPTLGGLTGSTDLASVITSGYGNVTAITLNSASGASNAYSGVIADGDTGMTLTKTGAGTQTLSGVNTYTGATTLNAGTLIVDGTTSASAFTVNGGVLGGSGTIGDLTIASGGKIAPGNSPGTLSVGDTTWEGDSGYDWEINNATGAAGVNWDLLDIAGTLNITATSSNPFTLSLFSLNESDESGNMINFDSAASYTFTIASASVGITGFSADAFQIMTGGFTNPATGSVSIALNGNSIQLNYVGSAVPEPATATAVFACLALGFSLCRRKRKTASMPLSQ